MNADVDGQQGVVALEAFFDLIVDPLVADGVIAEEHDRDLRVRDGPIQKALVVQFALSVGVNPGLGVKLVSGRYQNYLI